MRCMDSSDRPSPSSTTATGLPAYGVVVKTSTWANGRCTKGTLRAAGNLASNRDPVVGVERDDHDQAENGQDGTEHRAGREPRERELETAPDPARADGVERVAEQPTV